MTRKEAINKWVLPALENTWNKKKCGEIIEALKQEPCDDCISRQVVLDMMQMKMSSKELYMAVYELPPVNPQPKQNEWIPVSERLPEDDQSVLVWCPQYRNIYCAYLEKGQWWLFGAFVQIVPNEVVAWMPLPKPYDPQESEG